MGSSNSAYQGSIGNNGGTGNYTPPTAQAPNPQVLESRLAQSEPMLTVRDIAEILRVDLQFVRRGLDGLPEHRADLRGDGSYFVRSYYLSDVVSFLEKARGQPLPDGPLEPLLTPNEVAEIFHVHYDRVINWRNKGILHAYHLGLRVFRYDQGEVKALAGKLTTKEVAEMLHVSPSVVRYRTNKGILHAYQFGPGTIRYDQGEVKALVGKLTTKEVAEMLHVNPQIVYDWGNQGILPRVSLGKKTFRYDRGDVEALAERLGVNIDLELSQN